MMHKLQYKLQPKRFVCDIRPKTQPRVLERITKDALIPDSRDRMVDWPTVQSRS